MSVNDITGDTLRSKRNSAEYASGWDTIWGKLEKVVETIAEDAGEEPIKDEDVLRDIEQPLDVTGEEGEAWKDMERK